jgi:hypothetical protein
MSVREELERELAAVPGVTRHPARRGHGFAYFSGEQEIAHFHGEERLDVRLTREEIRKRATARAFDERVHVRGPSADWVAVHLAAAGDVSLALSLVRDAVRIHDLPRRAGSEA